MTPGSGSDNGLHGARLYDIVVSGGLPEDWSEWIGPQARVLPSDQNRQTTIRGEFDQASLHGILRRVYSLGIPLVSVSVGRHQ